jgi:hypothetical protein
MSSSEPKSWNDLQGLIGTSETSQVDFKRQLGTSQEIAKDIAAMTVEGGVIYYGIVEDQPTGLASQVAGIEGLAKAEERVSQIIGAAIQPIAVVNKHVIAQPSAPGRGVLVVEVPRSDRGPHMTDGRYPARSGTTTRWLTHEEVAALIRRPAETKVPTPISLLDDVALLPGITTARVSSIYEGFGQLRVSARPRSERLEHPASPRLRDALSAAAAAAERRAADRLAVYASTTVLSELDDWKPETTVGWVAGWAGQGTDALAIRPTAAAVVAYPWRTTLQVTLPTFVEGARSARPYTCAYEGRVAAELWAALAFVAEFYAVDASVQLDLGLHLTGFQGAVSYHATHAMEGLSVDHLPTAPKGNIIAASIGTDELRAAPENIVRLLVDRWLVSFYEGPDLLDYVLAPPSTGTRLH